MNLISQAAPPAPIDLVSLKRRQQAAWSSGNYAVVGTTLQIVGETLAETCRLRWGEKVLDVAAGNGNATLAAARRGCEVTSTDYVPELLELGRRRAEAELLSVDFQVADAEALPFEDASFDTVLSTFGVMFAPDHPRAAAEMLRVCRPGGCIALANWTPSSLIGELFRSLGRHLPPPAGSQSPLLWGTQDHIQALFGNQASDISFMPRTFHFRYSSAEHFVRVFRTWYGPVKKAFEALSAKQATLLEEDLVYMLNMMSCGIEYGARNESLVAPSDYLDIVITRK
ncbi:class I SAM-dependent methyltransferase [Pseudoxanthomonas suwonensis]|uniref:SAM-dependent methlyltransferase n=1 Tax=Pseudoxanthomonas suwonensis TaxID=314722 RepID=A0A0E3Z0C1_9GAMM|nr:class I SAM-dependent methyltransferase [Pseudoxanthomonas suwonensis]AKC86432.1 SAM-dependent methlyltransferase [Pseudoxanthomonas suwonensis]